MQRSRSYAAALGLGTLVLMGMQCPGPPRIVLAVALPIDGAVEDACDVQIVIQSKGTADNATLEATLNGDPLVLSQTSTFVFTADLAAGDPRLAADNEVVAFVEDAVGGSKQVMSNFQYTGDRARAYQIADPTDVITGPLGHSKVGDYMLANCVARFAVQDATPVGPGGLSERDLYSVGGFGGNLIDAERVDRPGIDNFLEMQPILNIETAVNPQTVEVVNDGSDGSPAILRACGPDDLLDFINPSTNVAEFGFDLPPGTDDNDQEADACTEYQLSGGNDYLTITTTITNNEATTQGFFNGDMLNAAGEVDPWSVAGGGIGDILTGTMESFSYIGRGEANGVDYSYAYTAIPEFPLGTSDFLSVSGVNAVFHSGSLILVLFGTPSAFQVDPGESKSYVRYFRVGDGSGGNAVDLDIEVNGRPFGTLEGQVTVNGLPAAEARIGVGPINVAGDGITGLVGQYVTDENGNYGGRLPPGSYGVVGWKKGTPYEGGGALPVVNPVTIAVATTETVDVALPQSGRVRVNVQDGAGQALPARATVVGFDPSPEATVSFAGIPGITPDSQTGLFLDGGSDTVPFGLTRSVYIGADGAAEFDLEPGSYSLLVSRGTEYSIHEEPIVVAAGPTPVQVDATLVRVLNTPGFISSDFHVHGIKSADSRVSQRDRVMQYAGEGVDNLIMTEHHAHNDISGTIGDLGLGGHLTSTVGEEITSWDYGHFNGYPFGVDPTLQSGGSSDWAGIAEPGRDFPEYGSYIQPPAGLFDAAVNNPVATADTTVQVNHIGGYFRGLKVDTTVVPPLSNLATSELSAARMDPSLDGTALYHHFPALELWNGSDDRAQDIFLGERIGVWFNLLNQGLHTTAVASTDSHSFRNLNSAGARAWTAASTDDPALVDSNEMARSVTAGRVVGGQGVYVQTRLVDQADAGNAADFSLAGSTSVTVAGGAVTLLIDVQAPTWAEYDRIEVYKNSGTLVTGTAAVDASLGGGTVGVEFSPDPATADILDVGVDFTRSVVTVDGSVTGADRFETHLEIPYVLAEDTWFVVVVRGREGVSTPMFPVYPQSLDRGGNNNLADLTDGNLGEGGTYSLGFTNPLYGDFDGTPGFQGPNE